MPLSSYINKFSTMSHMLICYSLVRRLILLCTIEFISTISDNYAISTARILCMVIFSLPFTYKNYILFFAKIIDIHFVVNLSR